MSAVLNRHGRSSRGVTLILVAGVLAVLAALSTGFYTLMLMQTRTATHYADAVRAEMMARAGIDYGVARLRAQTFEKTEDPSDPWFMVNYLDGKKKNPSFAAPDKKNAGLFMPYSEALGATAGPESDRFTLNISDAASKVNVNACDNLCVVLDNLCRVIGPPLVAADLDMLQPRRWATEGAAAGLYDKNPDDTKDIKDVYFRLYNNAGVLVSNGSGRPKFRANGVAVYGDGYAIAGYRARHGRFMNLADVKNALTYVERNGNDSLDDPLERLEVEVKFAALRDYITIDSWVDTNTVCVGKFEWINDPNTSNMFDTAIDRDKSWVSSVDDSGKPIVDPDNLRGTLRGCYVSIMNGHGAGQLRRIKENGIDWIQIETFKDSKNNVVGFNVPPGPISSYMIIAPDPVMMEKVKTPGGDLDVPRVDLLPDPSIDYARRPRCIHRAPININTASDKVLAALFMGLNVQHGHPMALGTDADVKDVKLAWFKADSHKLEPRLMTAKGLKRIPVNSGKLVFDKPMPATAASPQFDYLNNYGLLDPAGSANINEAQELAFRIIVARQRKIDPATGKPTTAPDIDTLSADPSRGFAGFEKGPFRSWDDIYFRVVRPWDDARFKTGWKDLNGNGVPDAGDEFHKMNLAPMIMAHFNSNTDILKFNPNIEWIDRWGRNFTEMEPVVVYTNSAEPHNQPPVADPVTDTSIPIFIGSEPYLKMFGRPNDSGAYAIRSFRYKSDEVIDKTDLNRSTTEFSFDSGGIFEIQSVGQVMKRGDVLAERRLDALVKVYDVWRESTQAQFVQGVISRAEGDPGTPASGQVTRDATNVNERLALTTLPEPLVPTKYKITPRPGVSNAEVVDSDARDAYGNVKTGITVAGLTGSVSMPDVVANRVLPASYDGQIVLATNTSKFDPANDGDTFLASFNGDLDTDTSMYNGREQAKTPAKATYRVVDTFGLLGLLNDSQVDVDPDLSINGGPSRAVYKFTTVDAAMKGLNPLYYWNNVTLRMGDLRADGVFLSGPGCSGNDATLKYLAGPNKENFDPASKTGNLLSMWFKPTWHHDDNRHHEFFNACNPGGWWDARQCVMMKPGRFAWSVGDDWAGSGLSGTRARNNDLFFALEGCNSSAGNDRDCIAQLHGGTNRVSTNLIPNEAPAYRIQPFRWHFAGARWNYHYNDAAYKLPDSAGGSRGHWVSAQDGQEPVNAALLKWYVRPFISTQRDSEGATSWKPDMFLTRNAMYGVGLFDKPCDLAKSGPINSAGTTGQDVKWDWADPAGANTQKVFSINNLNYDNNLMIYRNMPEEGTYAVIDELKLSNKDTVLGTTPAWNNDRITRTDTGELTLSRYYLPANIKSGPTFTSQTLLQSLRQQKTSLANETVALARVSWTVFTPRFMHEYKVATNKFVRNEQHTYNLVNTKTESVAFKGPFDYVRYNDDGDTSVFGVIRPPPPVLPQQVHATRGVVVQVLDDYAAVAGWENSTGTFVKTSTFFNPDVMNSFHDPANPKAEVRVRTDRLRYKVQFRYPVDPAIDNGISEVDGALHYLLDTPVFDDISITYFTRPRILSYNEVLE